MKQFHTLLILAIIIFSGCNQQSKKLPFDNSLNNGQTLIKGIVNKWHTDTVYMATLPFHSPFSTVEDYIILNSDKTFEFNFNNIDKPFILCLTPEKKFLDHRSFLLFECFTDKYYQGYCKNFHTMPMTTYLIEPGSETIVELTKTSRYGETKIKFLNDNAYNSKYYQTTFDLDQRFDEAVTLAKTTDEAIKNIKQKLTEKLTDLEKEKSFISPFLYKYTNAEIKFGAKKEFLRYLMLDHKEETEKLFKNEIPTQIKEVIAFDSKDIDYATLIGQEFNEFIELYLNFRNSELKNELTIFKTFDKEKFDFVLKELPQPSKYYYLVNNLLYTDCNEETEELYTRLIKEYPDGELNDKLTEKYKKTVANK